MTGGKPTLGQALHRAFLIHADQTDKLGEPYIGHIVRVVGNARKAGALLQAQIVAALHDTMEDGPITAEELRQEFGDEVARLVTILTRRPSEPYFSYIERVAQDPTAALVKREDLRDNLDPERFGQLPPDVRARLEPRYQHAWRIVLRASLRPKDPVELPGPVRIDW